MTTPTPRQVALERLYLVAKAFSASDPSHDAIEEYDLDEAVAAVDALPPMKFPCVPLGSDCAHRPRCPQVVAIEQVASESKDRPDTPAPGEPTHNAHERRIAGLVEEIYYEGEPPADQCGEKYEGAVAYRNLLDARAAIREAATWAKNSHAVVEGQHRHYDGYSIDCAACQWLALPAVSQALKEPPHAD